MIALRNKWGKNLARYGAAAVGILSLGLVVGLAACGDGSSAGLSPGQGGVAGSSNTVTVSGKATVSAMPDEVAVTLTVEQEAVTAPAAMDAASKTTQRVLDRLKADGIPDSAIETQNVTLYPIRTYDPNTGKETLTGYRAQNSVTVTLGDAPTIGKVLAAAVETGVTNVSGPVWRLRDESATVNEALKQAVANARAKAESLAAAGGVQVGEVMMISEGGVDVPVVPPPYWRAADTAAAGQVAEPPINPTSIDVTATVTVTYSLQR
jgi:uncharacterized protein YggE